MPSTYFAAKIHEATGEPFVVNINQDTAAAFFAAVSKTHEVKDTSVGECVMQYISLDTFDLYRYRGRRNTCDITSPELLEMYYNNFFGIMDTPQLIAA